MNLKYPIFSLVLVLLLVVGCAQSYKEKDEENEKLRIENQNLRDSLNKLNNTLATAESSVWCGQYDIEELQKLGFENPQEEILENLYNNTQLFSEDGVLGGTMRIDSGMLIGLNHVLALGSDGHIILYYLLKYEVGENKQIKWKVLNKFDAVS